MHPYSSALDRQGLVPKKQVNEASGKRLGLVSGVPDYGRISA